MAYFGVNYTIIGLAAIPGTYLLASLIPGILYDMHAKNESHQCYGIICFQAAFIIVSSRHFLSHNNVSVCCGVGIVLTLLLSWKTRKLYNRHKEEFVDQSVTILVMWTHSISRTSASLQKTKKKEEIDQKTQQCQGLPAAKVNAVHA